MLRRISDRGATLGLIEFAIVLMLLALILVASLTVLGDLFQLLFG